MEIDIIGWVATVLVLFGYWFNSNKMYMAAMGTWILGDLLWIAYDIIREIYPHLGLSTIIIILNVYGIYKIMNKK
jgi:hypothetical protein